MTCPSPPQLSSLSVLVDSGYGVICPASPLTDRLSTRCLLSRSRSCTDLSYVLCVYIYDVYLNQNVKLLFKLSFVHFGHVLLLHWFSMNIL